ncbi:MAG: ATP-binding protein [Paracoccus sp. (in: a-proteobacteria)]|uniref:two-component system sensor histidine kinase NtrB n=1 Tax=Paracoccus sp. TaxID=267 RepID=UPI0026DEDDEC|nr:ATP-binding protein [Paracoccus sp. (in: a-proteobacteria)]MDO5620431.1 ATP-binding protein [Paracoccus sp. (in: a-proteobacteria)]
MSAAPDSAPAAPDPVWLALPLPAIRFDAAHRVVSLNDLGEVWLNLSSKSVAGLRLDDPALLARLRVDPGLFAMLDRAALDVQFQDNLIWEIGDRTGGYQMRRASVFVSALPDGGAQAVIEPADSRPLRQNSAARAAIGMAEMLAHEIKNPLAGIRGAAQLLAEGLSPEDRDLADLIVEESRRVVALLEQVERFGDTSAPALAAVNIHDVLDRARQSFQLAAAGPAVVREYDPSLPPALVDPDRMMQLVLNLLRNAAEALARDGRSSADPRGPGTLRLRSHYDSTIRHPDSNQSLPLQLEIEDDGPGIPDAIAEHVFEPFVSGRENGTGLGLALVSKIANDHGAWLRLDSRPGRTLFRLSLPKA